jgi:predicted PurR-regulated permease PerM
MSFFDDERVAAGAWIALGVALLGLMFLLSAVLTPFALAAVLAYFLVPGCDWLRRRRCPDWLAALAMIVLAAAFVFALVLILVPVLQHEAEALREQWPALVGRINAWLTPLLQSWFGQDVQLDAHALAGLLAEKVGDQGSSLAGSVLERLRSGGVAVLNGIAMAVLVPVVLFYLLLEWHSFMTRLEAAVPRRWHPQFASMVGEIDAVLSQFLRGQLAVMAALAVYYGLALSVAGFKSALAIGVLTGTLIFVPYVGYAIGLVLALLSGLLQFEAWEAGLKVAIVYGFGQVLEGFFLTPRLVGKRIGLHPLAVIFALLAFAQLFGFFGVLVALPCSAVLLVALRRVKRAYLDSTFYQREP